MTALLIQADVCEGCDFDIDAAVTIRSATSDDRVLLTTADVSGSILLDVFEAGNPTSLYSTTMTAASVIENTATPWVLDSIGHNFHKAISMATLALDSLALKGGKKYQFVVRIPTVADGVLRIVAVPNIVSVQV